jgi:hypothetical protein
MPLQLRVARDDTAPCSVHDVSEVVGACIWGKVPKRWETKHRRLQAITSTTQFLAWLFVKHNCGGWFLFRGPGIAEANGASEGCQGP